MSLNKGEKSSRDNHAR